MDEITRAILAGALLGLLFVACLVLMAEALS